MVQTNRGIVISNPNGNVVTIDAKVIHFNEGSIHIKSKAGEKDEAIAYLKELNKGRNASTVVTRLRYGINGEHVEDFSYFANRDYMTDELLKALAIGQSLTSDLQMELNKYVIEMAIN